MVTELTAVRVLVVDDDQDMAVLVRGLLRAYDPSVDVYVEEEGSLGDAARRLLEGPRPDVVLLDLGLPDVPGIGPVSGIAVLASLPQVPPIIAVTGSPTDRGAAAVAAGASDYLEKSEMASSDRLWRAIVHAIERRRRNELIEAQRSQLLRTNSQLQHLASRLRHDLRTPVAVAVSAMDTLRSVDIDDDTRDGLLQMISTRLIGLSEKLDELTDTIVAGELVDEARRSELALPEIVNEVLEDLPDDEAGRLDLSVTCARAVWGSRRLLRGVVEGLLRNALQYNPEGDVRVQVDCRDEGGDAVITLADDGIGIHPAVRDAVFEVGWTTDPDPDATLGLGLAAARSAVAGMEGSIEAVDSPLGGVCFRIVLPQRDLARA